MEKALKNLLILLAIFLVTNLIKVYGIECDLGINLGGRSESELNELISKCKEKVMTLSQQRNTLNSEIQYMDTQIYLTNIKIQDTEQKIISTEKEIEVLGSRIEGLNQSIDYVSKLLLNKIVQGYKQRQISLFSLLFDSQNVDDLLSKIKYVKTTRDNNQKLLIQVQEAKSNFEEQKSLREEKKAELNRLTQILNAQKISLDSQKSQKQKLLSDTQNDEATYQRIINQARAQMRAFSSFVRSSGANSTIGANAFGSGPDGNYFSQRDERWANQVIGNSSSDCDGHPCSVLEAGCLISSVAMTLKKQGINTNPSQIASDPNYFSANTALMKFSLPNGKSRQTISTSDVDFRLQQGYVIVGINYGSCNPNQSDHFVVLTEKDGNNYKMYDPLYGPNEYFYERYSQICHAEILN